jgi:sialate O-acetylesterase
MHLRRTLAIVISFLGWLASSAPAEVRPHALISDGMVLQRGMKAPIWGTADEGEQVTVQFQGQEIVTTAKEGKWSVNLENLKTGGPFPMKIKGKKTIEFKNVLVGDVWIASGQSNMEWPVRLSDKAEQAIASSKNPMIRLFTVAKRPASAPISEVQGSWQECGPDSVKNFSAVAYFFGKDLQSSQKVPIGLIHTSWGGTPAEAWTSSAALESESSLKYLAERQARSLQEYPRMIDRLIDELTKYKRAVAKLSAEHKDLPTAPFFQIANPARDPMVATTLYNGMIAPLIPYAIKGAIWYQGESNAGRALEYRTLLPTMIKNWRADWKQGDFPFLIVQLAPFLKIDVDPQESAWAELREAQLLTTKKVPNTAIAVITDVGEEKDIHPKWKGPVGERLARAARALANGEKVVYSGPTYRSMKVEGSRIAIDFDNVGGGLVAKGVPLVGFTIAGKDRKFFRADAEILDNKVVVWSKDVEQPVAVRFGWANYPVVNLWNKDGLPASPFRTDDFPMVTDPRNQKLNQKPSARAR